MDTRVIIVDDEERGIVAMQQLLKKYCTDVVVEGTATNIMDAASMIRQKQPDAVFLDIEMPGGDGFNLLEELNDINFKIVFVTAYEEYALKAIKFSALDYLLKPVKIAELQACVQKIKQQVTPPIDHYHFLKDSLQPNAPFNRIVLSTMEGYYPVRIKDIIYCKAEDNYTHFYLQNGKHYLVSRLLKEYEDLLQSNNFFRIHKSYLINMDCIEKVAKLDSSVIMCNNDELPISFRKKEEFFHRLKH